MRTLQRTAMFVSLLASGCAIFRQDLQQHDRDASQDAAVMRADAGDTGTVIDDAGDAATGADDAGTGADTAAVSDYVARVLADEPIGYWRLDERLHPIANDSSGHERHGEYRGEPALGEPGPFGEDNTCAVFEQGRDLIVEGFPTFVGRQPYTVEAWVRPDKSVNGGFVGHGDHTDGVGFTGYRFALDSEFTPPGMWAGRGSGPDNLRAGSLELGSWHHVAMTYDGQVLRMYQNGEYVGNSVNETDLPEPVTPFSIGSATNWGAFYGAIDEVAVYDRALGLDELVEHYEAAR